MSYHALICTSACAAFGRIQVQPLTEMPAGLASSPTQLQSPGATGHADALASSPAAAAASSAAVSSSTSGTAACSSHPDVDFQRLLRLSQCQSQSLQQPQATPRFHGFISYRQEPEECDIPFGVSVAALFCEMASRAGVRLFHDTEHLEGGSPWIEALDLVLNSVGMVFVLLWPGALERCSQVTDPMRVEIITALRRPHCLVVPVVLFTDTVTVQSGIVPSWLKPLRMRHEAYEGGNHRVAPLDASELLSLQLHDWLLHTQAVFITRVRMASQLRDLFQRLPSVLGTCRVADSDLFDRLGVAVGMTREDLISCYVLHIDTCEHLNQRVQTVIGQHARSRQSRSAHVAAAAASPQISNHQPCQLSLLVWNCYGGGGLTQTATTEQDDNDGVLELFQVIKQYQADVLALQEAPYGLVELLREDGYTIVATLVCCEMYAPRSSSRKRRKNRKGAAQRAESEERKVAAYDVADSSHRMEIYNVIAVRADADIDPRQLQVDGAVVPPFVLSRCNDREEETMDGPVVVEESRRLQYVRLRMRAWTSGSSSPSASVCTLGLWNTHLEVKDESVRFDSLQNIADAMDHVAGRASIGERIRPVIAAAASHNRAGSLSTDQAIPIAALDAHLPNCSSDDQLLVGDLNAMSRLDYSPAERQYLSRVDRFHLGMASAHATDTWRCMDFAEDEQKWVDAFSKADMPRPKISVWSCRRVDHALLYRGCTWSVVHCFQVFTKASDHLPLFLVLQPPQRST